MKITVWIRPNKDGAPTGRVDYKLENADTPRIQNFGFRLIRAMTGEEIEEIQKRGGAE
jgi:hypothetical protein